MKYTLSEKIFDHMNKVIMFFVALICIYPFYYLLIYSISDPRRAASGVFFLPKTLSFENYNQIFVQPLILNSIFISFSRAVLGTVLTVLCSTVFAYLVTKEELPFRKFFYRFLIVTMYFNPGIIPWYMTMKEIGLKNNFLLYILPTAIQAFYVIILKTYIESIPAAFEESATIDGAGIYRIFTRIIFPLAVPILATVAVFSVVAQWNAWYDNLLLVNKRELKTLQLTLYQFFNDYMQDIIDRAKGMSGGTEVNITPMSVRTAISIVAILPVFVIYPLLQRFFIKGIMLGAIKG